ncbi:hypothetical protein KNE206_32280 [Kitasatospora sp. NE20-6]|uniref:hypothetical protein n=1 Tax=Kitasatospora sp. NE20-6 TaxID=2859066 RepID=UPI0034DC3E5E
MALVKKGSRLITVDGTTYRWRLRGRPTYDQGLVWAPLTYAVEHAGTTGPVLLVSTDRPHLSNWISARGRPVLPAEVAAGIRTALASGWTPGISGPSFHLDRSAGFVSSC